MKKEDQRELGYHGIRVGSYYVIIESLFHGLVSMVQPA